ncbi:MAG: transposase [Actinomycetota bacterium]|nr:transposase [Actinomycetota bacterium]
MERFHRTLRGEWVRPNDWTFATMADAQASLHAWVDDYNCERPHQSVGMVLPAERFRLAAERAVVEVDHEPQRLPQAPPSAGREPLGRPAGDDQPGGLRPSGGSHLCRRARGGRVPRRPGRDPPPGRGRRHPRPASTPPGQDRVASSSPSAIGPSAHHRPHRHSRHRPPKRRQLRRRQLSGRTGWARRSIDVAIMGGSVQLSVHGRVVRVHPIRHDRSKEHGAFATPRGRPRSPKTA